MYALEYKTLYSDILISVLLSVFHMMFLSNSKRFVFFPDTLYIDICKRLTI